MTSFDEREREREGAATPIACKEESLTQFTLEPLGCCQQAARGGGLVDY